MRKLFIICAIFVSTVAVAAPAAYQYFVACGQLYKIDANASEAEVLHWMDQIEATCD
ncbi:hypothetical protein [Bacteroides helcogenes]|uniref:Uncharacterized protein n=1 Tax=Bacteroides helcogenes (strain ATCC 35417 / DSM 20613 / JCM 6297 / CCUG 15421 / P 36-108) TaxID=693979 RepID=E6STE3_BACT6|nr:hypothetical protein [Bacteroides helcogenes]ADV43217.1 hypothetical protein Bache_1207 [Bacteroides helcogenes P 36-108]MDY5239192.1 hypothetical protein [Bacteroides helcogenes]